MADKSAQLVLEALGKAIADPQGSPLYGTKTNPGLFASSAAAKQAAQLCKDEGYLRVVRTETKGKSILEICAITEKGVAYLLSQVSPRKVLEEMVHTLQARQNEAGELLVTARQMQASFDALKATAEKVLQAVASCQGTSVLNVGAGTENGRNGSGNGEARKGKATSPVEQDWTRSALACLKRWQSSGTSEDCALSELYRQVCKTALGLTIGQFHDGLRRLHEQQLIYLHPWTGPMSEIPEPATALMVGHEIAYYASLR